MKPVSFLILLLAIFLTDIQLQGQSIIHEGFYTNPVGFRMLLSGTFGEIRSGHFHSGIDIKTQGVTGKPVFAVADGFVSRISVAPGGFGKAVYIDHPNGYTSVYGHCSHFSKEMDEYVRSEQYIRESFDVNLFPEKDRFLVKKGDIIAFSGNSGSSGGPHLHFEIRETTTEKPCNPLHAGFNIKDFTRPTISRLYVYPYGKLSRVAGKNKMKEFDLAGWGENYHIKTGDTIPVSGEIYFGIETHDLLSDSENKCGINSIELFIDNELVYAFRMDQFSFDETRYVMSHIDYSSFVQYGRKIHKTFIQPNNKLSAYTNDKNRGIILFGNDGIHEARYIVKDSNGNTSILTFHLKSKLQPLNEVLASAGQKNEGVLFRYDEENVFETEDIHLIIPEGALYDTLNFIYRKSKAPQNALSPLHHIHHKFTPMHGSSQVSIKPGKIDQRTADKALIVRAGKKAGELIPYKSTWEGDFLTANIRDFGEYFVVADTIKPMVTPVNIPKTKNIANQKNLQFKINDGLSGIDSYKGTLNGKWILMDWDPKNKMLTYVIDDRMITGKNLFRLVVTDAVKNETVYTSELIR